MDITISICDDNEEFVVDMMKLLNKYEWTDEKTIDTFTSGTKLVESVKYGKSYDIVFLDIELSEKYMGYDIGTMMKKHLPDVLLFYVSSYTKYSTALVNAEPFYFLQKPVFPYDLYRGIERAIERIRYIKNDFTYTYKIEGIKQKISLQNVLYFESIHRFINAYTHKNTIKFYQKLDVVQKEIEGTCNFFLRANKSCLVNANYITNVSRTKIHLDGIEISVTDTYKHDFFIKYAIFLT